MDNNSERPLYKRLHVIDETVGLHENCSFWLAILLPVAVCLFFMGCFYYQLYQEGGGSFNFTQPGIAVFIKYFSFPISLLSLSIVFGVMVTRFHSSKQRAVSNDAALRNNAVNYFYKTHEEFEKYCAKITSVKDNNINISRADACYAMLFSESKPYSPSLLVSESFFRSIRSIYCIYIDNFQKHLNGDLGSTHERGKNPPRTKHDFSGALPKKLNTFGIDISDFGYAHRIGDVDKELNKFNLAICQLFLFPGVENRDEAIGRLDELNEEFTKKIESNPKYKEAVESGKDITKD